MKDLISEMEKNFNVSLAISGAHLIKDYGQTIKDINKFKKILKSKLLIVLPEMVSQNQLQQV